MRANEPLVMALPKGRILGEVMPLVRRAGIEPEDAFDDPDARQLQFATNVPNLSIIRVRSFDVATFIANGAAHLGVAGNDVLMEFDYSEIYAPVDLQIGRCRLSVAARPELLQADAIPDNIAQALYSMLTDNNKIEELHKSYSSIHRLLRKGANGAAADAVCELLEERGSLNPNG